MIELLATISPVIIQCKRHPPFASSSSMPQNFCCSFPCPAPAPLVSPSISLVRAYVSYIVWLRRSILRFRSGNVVRASSQRSHLIPSHYALNIRLSSNMPHRAAVRLECAGSLGYWLSSSASGASAAHLELLINSSSSNSSGLSAFPPRPAYRFARVCWTSHRICLKNSVL